VMAILSPLTGKVVKVNTAASQEPTLLNSEKADENWLVVLTEVDYAAFEALENA
ncbi:glycine cleavage system protein H, partial [Streptococcus agalactiae]|nr:glycine cleavage system protein H [Streptococcus agalactiae]